MFGRKKERASKQSNQAARESERKVMAGKAAKLRDQRLAHDAATKKKAARSAAEKTKAISNSRAQRAKSAPSA